MTRVVCLLLGADTEALAASPPRKVNRDAAQSVGALPVGGGEAASASVTAPSSRKTTRISERVMKRTTTAPYSKVDAPPTY